MNPKIFFSSLQHFDLPENWTKVREARYKAFNNHAQWVEGKEAKNHQASMLSRQRQAKHDCKTKIAMEEV